MTVSCVSVCSSDALRKWRNKISSSVAWSNFVSNLMKTQQKLMKNWKGLMKSMLYQGHRFLGGKKHFWMAVSVEDEPRSGRPCTSKTDENMTKVRDLVRSDRRLTVRMISSVLNLNCQTIHEILTFKLGTQKMDATSRQCSLSHCHLHERIFGQKRYFSDSAATILAWSESMWLLPFPKTQIQPQRSSFWNCGQHPKGHDRPAEGTSTWTLPALLPGVGAMSPAVCGFPRELLWRG